ncbi:MAG: heme exporter protein CcmB [Planctomycetota bacterium]|nr:heme exporter protein CcmB [Planctomycetota bacterium]
MSTLASPERSAPGRSRSGSEEPAPLAFGRGVRAILARDLLQEWQSREVIPTMVVFALLVLFIFSLGANPVRGGDITGRYGPAALWITVFFSASIGVHRAFAKERESDAFSGLLVAPIDRTCIYIGKLISGWIFASVMAAVALLGFFVLYNPPAAVLWYLVPLLVFALFDYLAVGVILSAMTSSLRGGEVLLRLLLLPLMIPVFVVAIHATTPVLADGALPADPIFPLGALVGIGAIYLAAGTFLFVHVVEE